MRAARGRHLECVSTLLTHGADVDMTNEVSGIVCTVSSTGTGSGTGDWPYDRPQ